MRLLPGTLAILAALSPAWAIPAGARETMPRFYVYGENDEAAELKTCRINHDKAVALVKSQLRGAGMTLETDPAAEGAVMDTYININALTIETSPNFCAYSFDITFEAFNDATNPFTGKSEFSKLSYCSKGSLMIWPKAKAQAAMHNSLSGYVRACLTDYRGRNDR